MATQYGNLGNVYWTRGELDKAEEYYLKSLDLNEQLGRKLGMATQYGNLGIIYRSRGELDRAKEYYQKSLDLFKQIGAKRMIEKVQGWIDELPSKD